MIKNIDVIDLVPEEAAEIAQADAFFCDIPVVVMERGNVAAEIERKQAAITTKGGKSGVSVVVLQMVADDEFAEVRFGPLRMHIMFQVIEQVELNNDANGTKKSARKVARKLIQIFKAARLDGVTTDWQCDKPALEPLTLLKDGKLMSGLVGYQVGFNFAEADDEEITQVSAPQIAIADKQYVTATSATESEPDRPTEIWISFDDSIPMPGRTNPNSKAVLYAGDPLEIPDGCTAVRAAAFKAGCIGSTISRVELDQVS